MRSPGDSLSERRRNKTVGRFSFLVSHRSRWIGFQICCGNVPLQLLTFSPGVVIDREGSIELRWSRESRQGGVAMNLLQHSHRSHRRLRGSRQGAYRRLGTYIGPGVLAARPTRARPDRRARPRQDDSHTDSSYTEAEGCRRSTKLCEALTRLLRLWGLMNCDLILSCKHQHACHLVINAKVSGASVSSHVVRVPVDFCLSYGRIHDLYGRVSDPVIETLTAIGIPFGRVIVEVRDGVVNDLIIETRIRRGEYLPLFSPRKRHG